jgi:hypothetical protein
MMALVVRKGAASAAGILGLLTLVACSGPQAPGSGTAHATLLSVTFKQGSSYRYHYHLTVNGSTNIGQGTDQPLKIDSSSDVTWRVTSVDAAGNTAIDVTVDNLKTTVTSSVPPGATATTTTTTTTSGPQHGTITVAPNGEIMSGGAAPGAAAALAPFPGASAPGADQFLALLPDHGVQPGDTWTKSVTLPGPPGQPGISFTTDNRFLRFDNLKGGQAAVVETRAMVPIDMTEDLGQLPQGVGAPPGPPPVPQPGVKIHSQGTLSFDSTTWFDTRTHIVDRTRSVDSSDITTTFSGPLPTPPPGAPAAVVSMFPGVAHVKGTQTLQLDLL